MPNKRDARGLKSKYPETDVPRDERVVIRLTNNEKVEFVKRSKELGLTTTGFARMAINKLVHDEAWLAELLKELESEKD